MRDEIFIFMMCFVRHQEAKCIVQLDVASDHNTINRLGIKVNSCIEASLQKSEHEINSCRLLLLYFRDGSSLYAAWYAAWYAARWNAARWNAAASPHAKHARHAVANPAL